MIINQEEGIFQIYDQKDDYYIKEEGIAQINDYHKKGEGIAQIYDENNDYHVKQIGVLRDTARAPKPTDPIR